MHYLIVPGFTYFLVCVSMAPAHLCNYHVSAALSCEYGTCATIVCTITCTAICTIVQTARVSCADASWSDGSVLSGSYDGNIRVWAGRSQALVWRGQM